MREDVFKILEKISEKEGKSRGKIIEEAVIRLAAEKGIRST
jgi:hypothetical protein